MLSLCFVIVMTAYLDPNRHPNNLHILTNSYVTKILFDKRNGNITATGVQFVRKNVTYTVNAAKEVIISGGKCEYSERFAIFQTLFR